MGEPTLKALIIFAHGARDPRWAEPFQRLQLALAQQASEVCVRLAFLELMTPSLQSVAEEVISLGAQQLVIVPAFLGQGGHVRRDLPDLVQGLQQRWPQISIHLAQAVGEDLEVLQAIARYCLRQLSAA
jgi:sirohydrochlorin cobaltochelatase